jgi:hypothetical protein
VRIEPSKIEDISDIAIKNYGLGIKNWDFAIKNGSSTNKSCDLATKHPAFRG